MKSVDFGFRYAPPIFLHMVAISSAAGAAQRIGPRAAALLQHIVGVEIDRGLPDADKTPFDAAGDFIGKPERILINILLSGAQESALER